MIKRERYLKQLLDFKHTEVIKVITGIRRCGKSVLMSQFCELIDEGSQIININFESILYDSIKNYEDLYNYVTDRVDKNKKVYLLLDEIQRVKGWEKALASFQVDFDADIYITGSNAYLLSSELSTYLAGRYVEIHLLPLSFKEYVNGRSNVTELFDEYIKYGGFPGLLNLPTDESKRIYMEGIYNSVVVKDVLNRKQSLEPQLLIRILRYLLDNIGNLTSGNKIANYLTSNVTKTNARTVIEHIEALESAFVLYRAKRYKIKGKELLKTLDKLYVVDVGIRNMIEGYEVSDVGRILENIVYNELIRRGYFVTIGVDTNFEIDFIATKNSEKLYFQVALSILLPEVKDREVKGFKSIKDNYRKILLTMDYGHRIEEGIEYINIIEFLMEN
jgi:predicted AAA+ superfamily ATPase